MSVQRAKRRTGGGAKRVSGSPVEVAKRRYRTGITRKAGRLPDRTRGQGDA